MAKNFDMLVTGALLHDIGKLCQRAGRPYSSDMEGEILPSYKGRPSHWHALYTDYFIEKDLPLPEELEQHRSKIARIAAAHHRPDTASLLEMSIAVADRLSSGADRFTPEEPVDEPGYKKARLISVFDEIELARHRFTQENTAYYELKPLDAESSYIFPNQGKPGGDPADYNTLFDQFSNELKGVNIKAGLGFYADSLIHLLEKYTWAVPSSSYHTLPDVSLFDHSFSTAGIAQALYKYHEAEGGVPAWEDKQEKFLILGGDASGIQDYIFGISRNTGRGVSKIFRARSFYIQALLRSILISIQRRSGVYPVCRLVDSGGKFLLLLPNTESARQTAADVEADLQHWFRDNFKANLTVSLTWDTRLCQQDFKLGIFQKKLDECEDRLAAVKQQKLFRTFNSQGPVIDTGYEEFQEGNCSICGVNAADPQAAAWYMREEQFPEDAPPIPVCRGCYEQIAYIGKRLPNTKYIVYSNEGSIVLFDGIKLSMRRDSPNTQAPPIHIEALSGDIQYAKARVARHIPQVSDTELKDPNWFDLFENADEAGFSELIERAEGERPKTFNLIALKSKKLLEKAGDTQLVGRPLLGFLKADVDNLGLIFSLGLGDKLSVARLASASRMLELFFSEYLVGLIQREYPDIYVVFAGGDDLFLVGPWWQCLEFSSRLRKDFAKFCAENPDITLSAGILTAKPRLPMRKAAQLAEEHLEQAKKTERAGTIKDAVSFLNTVLYWDELEWLRDLGKMFDTAIEDKDRTNFTMGFLYRLLIYQKMYRRFHYNNEMKAGRFLSLAHYDIGRNIQHRNKNRAHENKQEMERLFEIFSVGVTDRQALEYLHIPLFYAMNRNRKM